MYGPQVGTPALTSGTFAELNEGFLIKDGK